MIGQPRISASSELAEIVYSKPLTPTEVSILKTRAQNYQASEGSDWDEKLFRPYAHYFGFQTALKVKSVCQEMWDHGYFESLNGRPLKILDIGAGTLGATLGVCDFLKLQKIKISEIHAMDRDPRPCHWAAKTFKDFLPARVQTHTQIPALESLDNTLIVAVDVFNESQSSPIQASLRDLISKLTPTTLLILIEPASKAINQKFLQWRDEMIQENTHKSSHLLLPCTHFLACPALPAREWCHEERDFLAPQAFWSLVQRLEFRRGSLVFSLMVWGGQNSKFKSTDARVVSRNLKSKGRCEKWLCANGKRWKAGMVKRKKSPENESFFEGLRGNVVDCLSTGLGHDV